MARPQRLRRICDIPKYNRFGPLDTDHNEEILLTLDEYEVLRLVDYEKRTHEQCARHMAISRTTVTEIYERARQKTTDAIVNGKVLHVEGGKYHVCDGDCIAECKECHKPQ